MNFPVLHALSALDIDYDPVLRYRLKKKIRFIDRDVRAIWDMIRIEKDLFKKAKLFLKMVDPKIKDGFIALDDIGPLLGYILRKRN